MKNHEGFGLMDSELKHEHSDEPHKEEQDINNIENHYDDIFDFLDNNDSKVEKPEFEFILPLNVSVVDDEILDKLFIAGCDDAIVTTNKGKIFLKFTRKADSLGDAILSACEDIHSAGYNSILIKD